MYAYKLKATYIKDIQEQTKIFLHEINRYLLWKDTNINLKMLNPFY